MKKLFALAATLMLSLSAHAAQFKEGTNYTKVDNLPAVTQPTVSEFFSFYCPHCFQFEPIVQQMKESLPEGVSFQKNHVSFMGGNMGKSMSKAYATMVSLDVEDKMIPVMFDRIHSLRQPPKTDAELRQIFIDNGVDGQKFDDAFNSFAVDSMVTRFDQQFQAAGLRGVPSIIVNNKYLVQTQGLESVQQFNDLVNYLLTLK